MAHAAARAWSSLPLPVRRPFNIVVTAIRLYVDDGCSTYAAAIAYYAIFSIIPLSLITLSVFGLVIDQDRIADWIFDQIPLQETDSVRRTWTTSLIVQEIGQASIGFVESSCSGLDGMSGRCSKA